jgi:hypothetical protein
MDRIIGRTGTAPDTDHHLKRQRVGVLKKSRHCNSGVCYILGMSSHTPRRPYPPPHRERNQRNIHGPNAGRDKSPKVPSGPSLPCRSKLPKRKSMVYGLLHVSHACLWIRRGGVAGRVCKVLEHGPRGRRSLSRRRLSAFGSNIHSERMLVKVVKIVRMEWSNIGPAGSVEPGN